MSHGLPSVCPGCGRDHTGDRRAGGAKWLAWAGHGRAVALGELPHDCVSPASAVVRLTVYRGGVRQARTSAPWAGGLEAFAAEVARHAERVLPDKSRAAYYLDARTRAHRRRDTDVTHVTGETLDCDGAPGGDWGRLAGALEQVSLGAVLSRSSSHTPERPRWHALIPYAVDQPFDVAAKDEWTRRRAWLLGYLSALAGLPGVGKDYSAGPNSPACGLDLRAKSGPGTPVYLPARRTADQLAPEALVVPGGALGLERFLAATGYSEARRAWLDGEGAREAARQESACRRRAAAGPAGERGASLRQLPTACGEVARRYVRAHALLYAGCGDRNHVALAIGGYLGGRGIAPAIARELVDALATAGGVGGDRGRAAEYSARNALAGRAVAGLPTVARLLGQRAAEDLAGLGEVLAPGARSRSRGTRVVEPRRLPVVSDAEHARWLRERLADVERVGLDRLPTGSGKSYQAADAAVERAARGESVLVLVDSHDRAEGFVAEAEGAVRRQRVDVHVASLPRLDCAERRGAELERVRAAGYNPVRTVCAPTCRRATERSCLWLEEIQAAWHADALVAVKAHAQRTGFWQRDRVAKFRRVIVEEDALDLLGPEAALDRQRVQRFVAVVLPVVEAEARDDAERAVPRYAGLLQRQARGLATATQRIREVADAVLEAIRGESGVVSFGAGEAWPAEVDERLALAAVRANRNQGVPLPLNVLPALRAIAGGQRAVLDDGVLRFDLPRPIPSDRAVVVLDATGDAELLAADLGRPVEVLEGGDARPVRVVQVTDSLWSRRRLGLGRDQVLDAEQLGRLADQLAAVVRRERAARVGLVTYRDAVEPLREALRRRLPGRPRWTPRRERLEILTLHFGAARGSNALAGVDALLVAGTPTPSPWAVQRRALRLGEPTAGELLEAPAWHDGPGGERVWSYASPLMRRAHESVVGAELAQAVGRGPRRDAVPRGGIWLLTSAAVRVPWPIERVRLVDLDQRGPPARSASWEPAAAPGVEGVAWLPSTIEVPLVPTNQATPLCSRGLAGYAVAGDAGGPAGPSSPDRAVTRLVGRLGVRGLAARLGVAPCTISRWWSGARRPTADHAAVMRDLLADLDGGADAHGARGDFVDPAADAVMPLAPPAEDSAASRPTP